MSAPGVYRAAIAASTSGNNTLVAAVADHRITVLSFGLVAAGAASARFESGAGGTALTGHMALPANGILVAPHNPNGHFATDKGALLNLELSSAVNVGGWLNYSVTA